MNLVEAFLKCKGTYKFPVILPLNNPPMFSVEFFKNQNNINNINCFSNEDNEWAKSKTYINKNKLNIQFREKFIFRRGRINCSLNDEGVWRWFGVQFSIQQN